MESSLSLDERNMERVESTFLSSTRFGDPYVDPASMGPGLGLSFYISANSQVMLILISPCYRLHLK